MTTILAIDLAKARSLFCWHDVVKGSQRWRTIPSTPRAFHEALTREKVDRVIIEVCDMAGWIKRETAARAPLHREFGLVGVYVVGAESADRPAQPSKPASRSCHFTAY